MKQNDSMVNLQSDRVARLFDIATPNEEESNMESKVTMSAELLAMLAAEGYNADTIGYRKTHGLDIGDTQAVDRDRLESLRGNREQDATWVTTSSMEELLAKDYDKGESFLSLLKPLVPKGMRLTIVVNDSQSNPLTSVSLRVKGQSVSTPADKGDKILVFSYDGKDHTITGGKTFPGKKACAVVNVQPVVRKAGDKTWNDYRKPFEDYMAKAGIAFTFAVKPVADQPDTPINKPEA